MAELDPTTLTWTEVSSFAKDDVFAEEGLTLLPDGSVLTVNMTDYPHAQRFIPNSDPSKSRWEDAGSTPVKLPATDLTAAQNIMFDNGKRVYHPPGEIGPAILRPDGTVFATGAKCNVKGPSTDPNACVIYQPVAHTAIYDTKTKSWTAGPDLPTHGGRGRYLRQPAAERECPSPNQSTRTHQRSARSRQRSLREHPQRHDASPRRRSRSAAADVSANLGL